MVTGAAPAAPATNTTAPDIATQTGCFMDEDLPSPWVHDARPYGKSQVERREWGASAARGHTARVTWTLAELAPAPRPLVATACCRSSRCCRSAVRRGRSAARP